MPCRHGDVPVPELLDVEAAPVVQSAAVSHEAGLWQMGHGAVFGNSPRLWQDNPACWKAWIIADPFAPTVSITCGLIAHALPGVQHQSGSHQGMPGQFQHKHHEDSSPCCRPLAS